MPRNLRPCLDENDLLGFAQVGAETLTAQIEEHIDQCDRCAHLVAEFAKVVSPFEGSGPSAGPPWRVHGDRVGRYRILGWIGRGGMGEVYEAEDPELGRRVALKLVHTLGSAEHERRLLREANLMAQLAHPNVVAVHDAGSDQGRAFIAMELVDGVPLGEWCAQQRRSWVDVVDVFVQVGRGLAAAHAAKLVHRDIKPANVLIRANGRAQIADFGLAWAVEDSAPLPTAEVSSPLGGPARLTQTGTLFGTPAYMSPEQHQGQRGDARSDQFSFCVSLYESVYGDRPFDGHTLRELMQTACQGVIRREPEFTNVPSWLRQVLVRGLSFEPEHRFRDMLELLTELRRGPRSPNDVASSG